MSGIYDLVLNTLKDYGTEEEYKKYKEELKYKQALNEISKISKKYKIEQGSKFTCENWTQKEQRIWLYICVKVRKDDNGVSDINKYKNNI